MMTLFFSAASDSKCASKITTYMCDIVKKILDLKNLFPYKTYHSSKRVKKKEKESKSSKNMKICEDTLSGKGYNKAAIDNISKQVKKVKRYSTIAISEEIMLRSISKPCYETLQNKTRGLKLPPR